MTQACAAIVQRDDPHLYATALFAPEPVRSRLMVLYAFDCELSRATRASAESLIPRMRLQWWRDVLTNWQESRPEHEVAGPLVDLLRGKVGSMLWRPLIDAHEKTLDFPMHELEFTGWASERYANRMKIAMQLSGLDHAELAFADLIGGIAQGYAFLFRNMARMAADGKTPLTLLQEDIGELARGKIPASTRGWMREMAAKQLAATKGVKRQAKLGKLTPVFLPLMYTERTLAMIVRDPEVVFGQLDHIDRPFDGLKLAWRVARGRW